MVRLMKIALSLGILTVPLLAQTPEQRIQELEERVRSVETRANKNTSSTSAAEGRVSAVEQNLADHASKGVVLYLFGVLCALWAQNTGRSAWTWFLLGVVFNVFTVLALLSKNSEDRMKARIRDAARIKSAA